MLLRSNGRHLLLLALLGGPFGCSSPPQAPYATPLSVTGAGLDSKGNGVAITVKNHYDAAGESTTLGTISVFGSARGCAARTLTPTDQTFTPLWLDDAGLVARRQSGNTRLGYSRIGQDGSLTEALGSAGSLPKPSGGSAPMFLHQDGQIFERSPTSGEYTARSVPTSLPSGARGIGIDLAGDTYWVSPPAGGIGDRSLKPTDSVAVDRPVVAELRAVGADGTLRFSVAVSTGTNSPLAAAVVPAGGVVVVDREQHMKRYLKDGAVAYDVVVLGGRRSIVSATDGSVVVASADGFFRFSGDGKEVWRQSLDGRLASLIVAGDDGRTWLLGTQDEGERRNVVRTELDASGAIVASDVCPGL